MAEPLFATTEDVARYIAAHGDPDFDEALALMAVDGATTAIRQYTRQHITVVEDDEVFVDGSGTDVVLLPQVPALNVHEVEVHPDTSMAKVLEPSEYRWTTDSGLLIKRFQPQMWDRRGLRDNWPEERQSIRVKYDHGYEDVPADIQMLTVVVAGRALTQDGARQEGFGESLLIMYFSNPGVFTKEEQWILDKYRVRHKR